MTAIEVRRPLSGYFRLDSAQTDFQLLVPAQWHKGSTFEWLRPFANSDLSVKPRYVARRSNVVEFARG